MSTHLHALATATTFATSLLAQWQQSTPPQAPPARYGAGLSHELTAGRTLLFGGAKTTPGFWNDTWSWDGTAWTQLAPATSPTGRGGIQLVDDYVRGVLVIYGGSTSIFGGAANSQTWEWNGTTWNQITTANSPGPLTSYGMAFDPVRQRTVLYGGIANPTFPIDSAGTWEYDGVNWVQITTATSPGPLENMAMCYSPALGRIVMYGGINVQIGGTTTTWTYDGTNWLAWPIGGPNPGVRTLVHMVYDEDRGVCVLQGGMNPTNGNLFNDVWEFSGSAWTQRADAGPATRRGQSLAFDRVRHSTLMFGGTTSNFTLGFTDTWHFGAVVDAAYGAGCAGSNGVPILQVQNGAHVAGLFNTTLAGLLPAAPLCVFVTGFTPLGSPFDLTGLGLPTCFAYATIDDITVASASGGVASHSVVVPANPALADIVFFYTGLSFDTVNSFGAVLSNTVQGQIGH